MSAPHIEMLLRREEKRAILTAICTHPQWKLTDVLGCVGRRGERPKLLASVTIGEILDTAARTWVAYPRDGGPPIDVERLQRAKLATGAEFDAITLEIIGEARAAVSSGYLRVRTGVDRGKMQLSLHRLVEGGMVSRLGSTSGTRYSEAEGSTRESQHG